MKKNKRFLYTLIVFLLIVSILVMSAIAVSTDNVVPRIEVTKCDKCGGTLTRRIVTRNVGTFYVSSCPDVIEPHSHKYQEVVSIIKCLDCPNGDTEILRQINICLGPGTGYYV